MAVVVLVLV